MGNSRGVVAGVNGWVGIGRGCGVFGIIVFWGFVVFLGAEFSFVLVFGFFVIVVEAGSV